MNYIRHLITALVLALVASCTTPQPTPPPDPLPTAGVVYRVVVKDELDQPVASYVTRDLRTRHFPPSVTFTDEMGKSHHYTGSFEVYLLGP